MTVGRIPPVEALAALTALKGGSTDEWQMMFILLPIFKDNLSYVYEGEGGQKMKQAHHNQYQVTVVCIEFHFLTHWSLVMPHGDIELGWHWLKWWLVAWRHQAIAWTNVDLPSVNSFGASETI